MTNIIKRLFFHDDIFSVKMLNTKKNDCQNFFVQYMIESCPLQTSLFAATCTYITDAVKAVYK